MSRLASAVISAELLLPGLITGTKPPHGINNSLGNQPNFETPQEKLAEWFLTLRQWCSHGDTSVTLAREPMT